MKKIPLTFQQYPIWLHCKTNGPDDITFMSRPYLITFEGKINFDKMVDAIRKTMLSHEVFFWKLQESEENNAISPYFIRIDKSPNLQIRLSTSPTNILQDEGYINQEIFAEAILPIGIYSEDLAQFVLFKANEDRLYLLLKSHHIIMDGWSINIIRQEIVQFYLEYIGSSENVSSSVYYPDYSEYGEYQFSMPKDDVELFWKKYLDGNIERLALPFDHNSDKQPLYKGLFIDEQIENYPVLLNIARNNRSTLYDVLFAAYSILIYWYCGNKDFIIATPMAGRDNPKFNHTVGFLSTYVAIRPQINLDESFTGFLKNITRNVFDVMKHQNIDFLKLVEFANFSEDLSRPALFDVAFVFQNTMRRNTISIPDINISEQQISLNQAKTFVLFELQEISDGLSLHVEYAECRFYNQTILRMIENYKKILLMIEKYADKPMSTWPIFYPDYAFIAQQLKHTQLRFVQPINLRWYSICQMNPDKVCIDDGQNSLTYEQLNILSNQLAYYIRDNYDLPSKRAIIYLDKSLASIVAILAFVKLDISYIPVSTSTPLKRLIDINSYANPDFILSQKIYVGLLSGFNYLLIDDEKTSAQIVSLNKNNVMSKIELTDELYVIYTSGSTGVPKGVPQTHYNVSRLFDATDPIFKFNIDDVWVLFHELSFDFSVWEIYGALLTGAKLIIASPQVCHDTTLFCDLVEHYKITVLNQTPLAFNLFVQNAIDNMRQLDSLRLIILGGDSVNFQVINKWMQYYNNDTLEIYNMYGITEATVHTTYLKLTKELVNNHFDNEIGCALPDMELFLMRDGICVPDGVVGEICITGSGLSPGYLNDTDLTNKKFKIVSASQSNQLRFFLTGDLARQIGNGYYNYEGRINDLVKFNGWRISLTEINRYIKDYPDVEESVVVKNSLDDHDVLSAYIVTKSGLSVNKNDLSEYLSSFLPYYMLPTKVIQVDVLPLTNNLKIDYKRLEHLKAVSTNKSDMDYLTPIQVQLMEIWKTVLNLDAITIDDNFYEIGGNSISAILISAKFVRDDLKLTPAMIQKNKTIRSLSKDIESITHSKENPSSIVINQQARDTSITPFQDKYLVENLDKYKFWNQTVLIKLVNRQNSKVVVNTLRRLIDESVVAYYKFAKNANGQWRQNYTPDKQNELEILKFSFEQQDDLSEKIDEIASYISMMLNLDTGKVAFIGEVYSQENVYLLVCVHHLYIDAISWIYLINNLISDLNGSIKENFQILPTANELHYSDISFRQVSKWRDAHFNSMPLYLRFYDSWKAIVDKMCVIENDDCSGEFKQISFSFDFSLGEFKSADIFSGNNPYLIVIISAIANFYKTICSKPCVRMVLEHHGREAIESIDIANEIGCFTAYFPFFLSLDDEIHDESLLTYIANEYAKLPSDILSYGYLAQFSESSFIRQSLDYKDHVDFALNYIDNTASMFSTNSFIDVKTIQFVPVHLLHLSNKLNINVFRDASRLKFDIFYKTAGIVNTSIDMFKQNIMQSITRYVDIVAKLIDQQNHLLVSSSLNTKEYMLTPLQEGMLYHFVSENNANQYVVQIDWEYQKAIDANQLYKAWQCVLDAYPQLHVKVVLDRDVYRLMHDEEPCFSWKFTDLSEAKFKDADFHKIVETDYKHSITIFKKPLMHFHLVKLEDRLFHLLFTHHHVLLDGWSIALLINKVHHLYTQATTNPNFIPSDPVVGLNSWYKYMYSIDKKGVLDFWARELADYSLPFGIFARKSDSYKDKYLSVDIVLEIEDRLESEVLEALIKVARGAEVSLSSVFLYGWANVLSLFSGSNKIIFGEVVSGRAIPLDGVDQIVGMLINTIPMAFELDFDKTIKEELVLVDEKNVKCISYASIGLRDIINSLPEKLDWPMFDTLFVFENYPQNKPLDGELFFDDVSSKEKTNYPVTLLVKPNESECILRIIYSDAHFDDKTIRTILDCYINYLAIIAKSLNKSARCLLSIGSGVEVNSEFSQKPIEIAENQEHRSIVDDILEALTKEPNKIVLIDGNVSISARQLLATAFKLSTNLNSVAKEHKLIPLVIGRSWKQIVAILAVLLSGRAFVPLESEWPYARIKNILQDIESSVVLTDDPHLVSQLIVILIDDTICSETISLPATPVIYGSDLAYIIYTSGTTGKPKGVMISHSGVYNTILTINQLLGVNHNDVVLQLANYSFDLAIYDILGLLSIAGRIIIVDKNHLYDPDYLVQYIQNYQVTLWNTVPQHMQILISYLEGNPKIKLDSLKHILLSGDLITISLAVSIKKYLPNAYAYSLGGATEGSIWSIYFPLGQLTPKNITVPYGTALKNQKIYIMDNNLRVLPVGVPGTIYIGGSGVALGYFKGGDLNKSFVYHSQLGDNLYCTGDRGVFLSDGNVEFLGRIEPLYKYHGYRIDLKEIAFYASKVAGVYQAFSYIWHKDDGSYICLFVEGDPEIVNYSLISNMLSQHLPYYSLPQYILIKANFPLSENGKVSIKQLLDDLSLNNVEQNIPTQISEIEEFILRLWIDILSVKTMTIEDNFFQLGGDSIMASRIINAVNKQFSLNLTVKILFENPTVHAFGYQVSHSSLSKDLPQICSTHLDKNVPLSFAQESFWVLYCIRDDNKTEHHIPLVIKLHGKADPVALYGAFIKLINRHYPLKSHIYQDGMEFRQEVFIDINLKIYEKYLDEGDLNQEIHHEINRPFMLENDIPLRVSIFYVGEISYIVITFHHIAFDFWSLQIFCYELSALYNANITGVNDNLSENPINYYDYAIWQKQLSVNKMFTNHLQYWLDELKTCSYTNLPMHNSNKSIAKRRAVSEFFIERESISNLAQKENVTISTVLLSLFQVLLCQYDNNKEIAVGCFNPSRYLPELENLIGPFVNIQVIKINLEDNLTFADILQLTMRKIIDAEIHNCVPFEKILTNLGIKYEKGQMPLVNVCYSYQKFNRILQINLGNIASEVLNYSPDFIQFDMVLFIYDSGDGLINCQLEYDTNKFDAHMVEIMVHRYKYLMNQVIANVGIIYQDLSRLHKDKSPQLLDTNNGNLIDDDNSDYYRLINELNNRQRAYPDDKTIHELFEQQVARTPDNIAVVYEDIKLTYTQLNQRANQLAHYLRNHFNIKGDDLIALCLDRSELMLIAILGVLKSGGAYVPVDPSYPDERIAYIMEDTKSNVVLTNKVYGDKLGVTTLLIDSDELQTLLLIESTNNPQINISSSNLAYVIYTSGTTGKPKGVMIEHKSVVNLNQYLITKYKLGEIDHNEVILQFANYVFDASVEQIVLSLLNGYQLLLIPNEIWLNSQEFYKYLNKNNVTHIHATPTLLAQYDFSQILSLRRLVSGGDVLSGSVCSQLLMSKVDLINEYGPTETTITCLINLLNEYNLSIGRPISNTQVYILGVNLQLVPYGAIGELYIGGAGLARGYLNQPQLTAHSFIANPFQTEEDKQQDKNARLYKTGDLVRYLADDNLEYIGRIDDQVKIRGFRVELEEIKSVMLSHPLVEQAIVILDNQNKDLGIERILAFYVPVSGANLDNKALAIFLKKWLPEYMMPSYFVPIDSIPLTLNGKIDRKELLSLFSAELIVSSAYGRMVPFDEVENVLLSIWSAILNKPAICDVDFYDQGGNSILSIILLSKIVRSFKLSLPASWIFEYKTIAMQADFLKHNNSNTIKYHPIATFNSGGDSLPFFLVHAGNSGAYVYSELARYIDPRINFYGVDSYNLLSGNNPINTIHGLAEKYLTEIKKACPKPPYILGGWCYGGLIAYEMAQILLKDGMPAPLLILLDAHFYTIAQKDRLQSISQELMNEYVMAMPAIKALPENYVKLLVNTYCVERNALLNYSPSTYNGKVLLVKPDNFDETTEDGLSLKGNINEFILIEKEQHLKLDNGWSDLVQNLEIVHIAATHQSMVMDHEKVKDLAQILNQAIYTLYL